MVQMFLPKIHRARRRIRRQMARQKQLLEEAAEFFNNPGDNYGAPGESPAQVPKPSMHMEQMEGEELGGLPECPADLITCPAPVIDPNAKLSPPTSHFQHTTGDSGHQGVHHQGQQNEPGPMPGVRPPMGGAGGIVPPPTTKGSGAMGIIMPLYTVGIVVFFVYTIMKVLFKKGQDDDKTPKLKDFGLDPEYRKYVFAEEYLDNTDISSKDMMRQKAREESRNRKKAQTEVPPDTKIAEGNLLGQGRMDTQGKKLGTWYLPEGFLDQDDVESDEEYQNDSIGGTTVEESANETLRERLYSGNKKKKDKKKRRSFIYEDINSPEDLQNIINMRKTEKENKQKHQNPATKYDLEDSEDEEMLTDLDYLYSNEFLSFLKKGLRNYDPDGNLDGEMLESLCMVARDHLRSKYIDNVVENETGEFQEPFENHPQSETMESSYPEEEMPEEILHYAEEERLEDYDSPSIRTHIDSYEGFGGSAEPTNLDGSDDERSSFKDMESEDDLEYASEPEKDIDSNNVDSALQERLRDTLPNDSEEGTTEGKSECEKKDEQLDQLRKRLEETEKAMERLMCQMGSVTDKLTAAKITEVLSQAQAQAKILKEEVGEMTSEEDLTSSEALTTTLSEDTSLPASLQRHLEEIQKNEDSPTSSKGSSPDMDEYEVITKEEDQTSTATKEKNTKGGAETSKMSATTTQKEETREKVEEVENEEEEEEEEEMEEEEEEVEEVPKKEVSSKRPTVDIAAAKAASKTAVATEESSDDE